MQPSFTRERDCKYHRQFNYCCWFTLILFMLLPVLCVCVCKTGVGCAGNRESLEGETKEHVCVYLGVWGLSKEPWHTGQLCPNTCWRCGWERDHVEVKMGAGNTCRGEINWIPGLVSQSLLGLTTWLNSEPRQRIPSPLLTFSSSNATRFLPIPNRGRKRQGRNLT